MGANKICSGFNQQEADFIAEKRLSEVKLSKMNAEMAVLHDDFKKVTEALAENERVSVDLERSKQMALGDLAKKVDLLDKETKKEAARLKEVKSDILAKRRQILDRSAKESDALATPAPRFAYIEIEESLNKHKAFLDTR